MDWNKRTGAHQAAESGASTLESTARVTAIVDAVAWLEPEHAGGCGSCAAASACRAAALFSGRGGNTSRLQARRFPLARSSVPASLRVGDRVVVGIPEGSLVKAALTAYLLPLFALLAAGGLAQTLAGSDGVTFAAMAGGLAFGLLVARRLAHRRSFRGELAPRFLRRADGCESGHPA